MRQPYIGILIVFPSNGELIDGHDGQATRPAGKRPVIRDTRKTSSSAG